MDSNPFYNTKIIQAASFNAGATTTTGLEGDAINMQGLEGVIGICPVATSKAASGVLTMTFQHKDTTADAWVSTLAAIEAGAGESGKALVLSIANPLKKWGRFRIVTSGNGSSPHGGILALGFKPNLTPVAQSTGEVIDTSRVFVSPSSV